jgi:hypothetical protein
MPPSTYQVHALVDFTKQQGDIARVVLAISVQRNHNSAIRISKTRSDCCGLAKIFAKLDDSNTMITHLKTLKDLQRVISAAIVNK